MEESRENMNASGNMFRAMSENIAKEIGKIRSCRLDKNKAVLMQEINEQIRYFSWWTV